VISSVQKIFLSGICGTGMASLAGMLRTSGHTVSGSDSGVYPPMSTFLQALNIPVFEGFSASHIEDASPDLVVIGNALSRGNPEVEYVLDRGLRYSSMAETVKEFFIRGLRSTVIAGTHGKTTTSALLAWMLESAGRSHSFLVGGVAENFSSSYQLGSGPDFVIEGDEYDTAFFDKGPKFLHYLPNMAVIKNIEFDHADIYESLSAIQTSFRRLINIVPQSGLIVAGVDSPGVREILGGAPAPVQTFGLESGDWTLDGIAADGEGTRFNVLKDQSFWHGFWIPLVGEFNALNALSAIVAANKLGLSKEEMNVALRSFKNVRRRLEVRGVAGGVTVYDDFAHHPTAVAETLRAIKTQFPDSIIWAVFEPRSQTSRRRLFESEFAQALALADVAVIAPVYSPRRLPPEEVLSPGRVAEKVIELGTPAHAPSSTEDIVPLIGNQAKAGDRVVVMSNGAFGDIHRKLIQFLDGRS
jgi:UDP-N-acetylmuramate: L-alanyl-gamma-D-glutamyl-meso-diaminopimelate ligase